MDLGRIRTSLVANDNVALQYIYTEYGGFCVRRLMQLRNCTLEDAQDLFIEAVMNLREKILNGSVQKLTSTRYYLFKTCENMYLARLKDEKGHKGKTSDIEKFYYGSVHFLPEDGSPDNKLIEATRYAWKLLSEKCKDIIYYFYVDKMRMEDIAELLGLANSNVAKTTKARCYKSLMDEAGTYYNSKLSNNAT